jgi:hypothetical protein
LLAETTENADGENAEGGAEGDGNGDGEQDGAGDATTSGAAQPAREPNKVRITTPYLTKYERARILGTRALQIRYVIRMRLFIRNMNFPVHVA